MEIPKYQNQRPLFGWRVVGSQLLFILEGAHILSSQICHLIKLTLYLWIIIPHALWKCPNLYISQRFLPTCHVSWQVDKTSSYVSTKWLVSKQPNYSKFPIFCFSQHICCYFPCSFSFFFLLSILLGKRYCERVRGQVIAGGCRLSSWE